MCGCGGWPSAGKDRKAEAYAQGLKKRLTPVTMALSIKGVNTARINESIEDYLESISLRVEERMRALRGYRKRARGDEVRPSHAAKLPRRL